MAFSILAVFIFVLTWDCTSSKVSWLFLSNIQPDTLSGVWIPNFLISRNCSLSSEQHEKSVWSPSWWVDKRTSPSPLAFGHGPSTACSIAGGTIEAMRDIYIPICNDPVNDYWEWGQRSMLYKRKLTLQGKELVG